MKKIKPSKYQYKKFKALANSLKDIAIKVDELAEAIPEDDLDMNYASLVGVHLDVLAHLFRKALGFEPKRRKNEHM